MNQCSILNNNMRNESNSGRIGKRKNVKKGMGQMVLNIVIQDPTISMVRHDQHAHHHDHACNTSPKSNSSVTSHNNNSTTTKCVGGSLSTITKWKRSSTTFANYIVESNSFYSHDRRSRIISEKEMIGVLHLSQQKACKQLDCSLSTLKRRFYELKDGFGLERWPQYFFEIRHLPIFQKIYPMNLGFILNDKEEQHV